MHCTNFDLSSNSTHSTTRSQLTLSLCIPSAARRPGTISSLFTCALLWNSLPSPIRSASSLHTFRQDLQKYLGIPVIRQDRPVGFPIKQQQLIFPPKPNPNPQSEKESFSKIPVTQTFVELDQPPAPDSCFEIWQLRWCGCAATRRGGKNWPCPRPTYQRLKCCMKFIGRTSTVTCNISVKTNRSSFCHREDPSFLLEQLLGSALNIFVKKSAATYIVRDTCTVFDTSWPLHPVGWGHGEPLFRNSERKWIRSYPASSSKTMIWTPCSNSTT